MIDWFRVESQLRFRVLYPLWAVTACRFGWHRRTSWPSGQPGNFCEACRGQLNPDTYSWYHVTSTDGELDVNVAAVNAQHALAFFAHQYHRANLRVAYLRPATGMTIDEWRREMRDYIERAWPVHLSSGVSVRMR